MDMTDARNVRVVDYEAIRSASTELETLAYAAKAARDTFSEAVKAAASKAGVDAAVLRAFITSRIADDPSKKAARAEQLSLLFVEVGS